MEALKILVVLTDFIINTTNKKGANTMDNTWYIVYKLRRAHFNKKLCRHAADIIENLANDLDYRVELYKDARVETNATIEEANAILEELQATQKKLAEAEKYIKEHF